MLVGELEGEVSTDRLTFEAYKEVEKFDFVTVKNPKEGQEWILAQVDTVTKHPDGKAEAEAQVIGFREDGMLKQPRHVVKPDSMVYRADEDVIADTLGLTQEGLYMGRLDTNPDIRIFVDPEDLYKHIAVLAKTGAGKSYATGVMIEELLEQDYPVLIIDPHGEYHSLARENEVDGEARDMYGIGPKAYPATEYSTDTTINQGAEKLSFSSRNLGAKELEQMVPTSLTNSQLEVLYNALKTLDEEKGYDLQDVVDACMSQDSKAKWNLVNILEIVQDSNLFEGEPNDLGDLVRPGEASIINLKGVDPETQEMVVYKLAKELFDRRKRGELQPFFMIMEEAHNFVPERNFGKAVCSDILRTIASEGRKFGLGIGVISQRPARVDKNILSQCNTQMILRVTNPNDLNAISRSFEGVTSEVKDFITSLPPGTGLLLGKEYPVMTDIRTRRSLHGGETKQLSREGSEEEVSRGPEGEDVTEVVEEPEEPEPAEPPQDDPDPAASPEPAGDAGTVTADVAAAGSEQGEADEDAGAGPDRPVQVAPSLDFDRLDAKLDGAQIAYYPLHVVRTSAGAVAVDATDGEVKAERSVPGTDADVMELLRHGERTTGDLVEALDLSLGEVERVLADLQERGRVEEENGTYIAAEDPILDRDREPVDVNGHTLIEADLSEGDAEEIAAERVGGEVEDTELVYYPYYTAGERVFDAVRGEEI